MSEPSHLSPDAVPKPLPRWMQWLLRALALLSLGLGFLGMFLPVLPTTPFILLAAWAATRSSPRLLAWLENHRLFGTTLRNWRRGGVVSRKAKWAATWTMSASAVVLLLTVGKLWAAAAAIACMATVLVWLWQRPETFTPPP
ncbi:MAG TPA: YbaN family protein [Rhodoferax sp.]|nr:YbaN family protein [Rhodoferax sp.]HPW84452.1 YbaN family protein [Rhodoferax sp.]